MSYAVVVTSFTKSKTPVEQLYEDMATVGQAPTSLSSQDRLDRFYRYSQYEISDLREEISSLEDKSAINGEQANAFDHCSARIAGFADSIRDAASFLPAHDQRTYCEAIKALTEELQKAKSSVAPRQKFSFKKKNASAVSINDAAELAAQRRLRGPEYPSDSSAATSSFAVTPGTGFQTPAREAISEDVSEPSFNSSSDLNAIRKPSFSQSSSIKISGHTDQHIILPSSASHATTQGTLSNLSNCVVDMSVPTASAKPFAGLTLKEIESSLIVCGHVNGPAHLTGISDSTVVVACRQFRMHESKDVDVYLHCGSRPIIEDCSNIRFAPLPDPYITKAEQGVTNQFDQIDDFKWLRSEPNPNWSVLDPSMRVEDGIWTEVVPGKAGVGHTEILAQANVRKTT